MSKHLSPAYQLYSAREDASNDLEGVLDQLSRMGYEGVEFAGFFEKTAKEVRKLLKHTGLKAVSSHVPLQQIRDDMQSVRALAGRGGPPGSARLCPRAGNAVYLRPAVQKTRHRVALSQPRL